MTVRRSVGFAKAIRVTTQREKQMETKLPERINVTKVVTYDVEQITRELKEQGNTDISLQDILDYIDGWVNEDFGCGFGHENNLGDLIFQDQDGEEL